jgi:hypothetical protein
MTIYDHDDIAIVLNNIVTITYVRGEYYDLNQRCYLVINGEKIGKDHKEIEMKQIINQIKKGLEKL